MGNDDRGYEDYFKGSKSAYIDFGGGCSFMEILKATDCVLHR